MLHYPKIPGSRDAPVGRCVAFEKYDGTNLHWDWDRDFGWHAFGTRRDAFNLNDEGVARFGTRHPQLRDAPPLMQSGFLSRLAAIFEQAPPYRECQEIKVFTEFFGSQSFAGLHKAEDPKELRLLDVELVPGRMVPPEQFVADFGALPIARVVYQGKLTGAFAEDVRAGRYGVAEGVVCKGVDRQSGQVWMAKIKTYAYLERLKEAFAERWEDYWE